jgi:hypothetical protein
VTRTYQELIVALRHGVTLKRKATMKFNADIKTLSARIADQDHFHIANVEAASPIEAARIVADQAALRLYDAQGMAGFLAPAGRGNETHRFRAVIGHYHLVEGWGIIHGITIVIALHEQITEP